MRITLIVVMLMLSVLGTAASADSTPEALYTEGQTAYDASDFATAITRWEAAYDLSKASGLLFNLGQAYRQHGDCRRALTAYGKFIVADSMDQPSDPPSEQRQIAEEFSREMAPQCKDRLMKPASQPASQPASPAPHLKLASPLNLGRGLSPPDYERARADRRLANAGLAIGGSGAALLATGLILGHHADVLAGRVTSACASSCNWATVRDDDAAGRRAAAISRVLDVVGIAAIVGGAAMYYLGRRAGVAISVSPQPHEGAAVSWSGSW